MPAGHRFTRRVEYRFEERGGDPRNYQISRKFRREYKIVVYAGLNCDSVTFEAEYESERRINLFLTR